MRLFMYLGFGGFYLDWYYLVLVVPALIIAFIAEIRVKSTFSKYSQVVTRRGLTGADAAEAILRANGIRDVHVMPVSGTLTDHFDPKENVIHLSDSVYSSQSVAAVGVAAHEAGHAVQYAESYGPIKARTAIIPVTRVGSMLAVPLILLGIVFSIPALYAAGVVFFSLAMVFQLVTLPVEFNASRRAVSALETTAMLGEEEIRQAKKVLSAAALTYVATFAVSLMQLLRLVLLGRNRNRR